MFGVWPPPRKTKILTVLDHAACNHDTRASTAQDCTTAQRLEVALEYDLSEESKVMDKGVDWETVRSVIIIHLSKENKIKGFVFPASFVGVSQLGSFMNQTNNNLVSVHYPVHVHVVTTWEQAMRILKSRPVFDVFTKSYGLTYQMAIHEHTEPNQPVVPEQPSSVLYWLTAIWPDCFSLVPSSKKDPDTKRLVCNLEKVPPTFRQSIQTIFLQMEPSISVPVPLQCLIAQYAVSDVYTWMEDCILLLKSNVTIRLVAARVVFQWTRHPSQKQLLLSGIGA